MRTEQQHRSHVTSKAHVSNKEETHCTADDVVKREEAKRFAKGMRDHAERTRGTTGESAASVLLWLYSEALVNSDCHPRHACFRFGGDKRGVEGALE